MKKGISILVLSAFLIFSCNKPPKKVYDTINIASSIKPIEWIISQLASKKCFVSSIIPFSQDPHTFEFSPKILKNISNADIYFSLGSNLEFEDINLPKFKEADKSLLIIPISKDITLLNDAHIWLSLRNLKIMASNITESFLSIDSVSKYEYEKKLKIFEFRCGLADSLMTDILKRKNIKTFIIDHPSLSYFARDYGLTQIPIAFEGREPSLADIKDIIDLIRKNNVKIFITSPKFQKKYSDLIKNETGIAVILFDPLRYDIILSFEKLMKDIESYDK